MNSPPGLDKRREKITENYQPKNPRKEYLPALNPTNDPLEVKSHDNIIAPSLYDRVVLSESNNTNTT